MKATLFKRIASVELAPNYCRYGRSAGHTRRRLNIERKTHDSIFSRGDTSARTWTNDEDGVYGEIAIHLMLGYPIPSLVTLDWQGDHVWFRIGDRAFGGRTTVYKTGKLPLPSRVRGPDHPYGYVLLYVGAFPRITFCGYATYEELLAAPVQMDWEDPCPALSQKWLHDLEYTSAIPLLGDADTNASVTL